MNEQNLIQRCQAGEAAAFEILLGRYEGLIYNLVRRYFENPVEAEDAAQEAMVKIYRRIGDFRGRASFKTWVYRVVTNVCLDTLRRRPEKCLSLEEIGPGEPPALRAAGGPEDALEQAELREILAQLLLQMDADQRNILILREIEGLSYDDIASVMGCSLGTMKSRLARAREALGRRYGASPRTRGLDPRPHTAREGLCTA
ncbi:MAG: RNA polymerase sigma factor [Bacteroidota bacterium]